MEVVRVLLVGGPADLTGAERVREVSATVDSIALPRGAGYEHFTDTGRSRELHGSPLRVFEWAYQTKIAE